MNTPSEHLQKKPAKRLLVAGYALWSEGYPNARNTLRILKETLGIHIHNFEYRLPPNFHLWKLTRASAFKKLLWATRLFTGNLFSALKVLAIARKGDQVYVPYPSIFFLWFFSWLPKRLRPICISDAYITLWDSIYQDRIIAGSPNGIGSRILLAAESRALRASTTILVDSEANALQVAHIFHVPHQKILSVPLAIDPPSPAHPKLSPKQIRPTVEIVFVGTFVPLQGTTAIARAITLLPEHAQIHLTIIGDGQMADEFSTIIEGCSRVTWLRGWSSPDILEYHLARADICLGIFGGAGKASRVLPFKLYAALAAGNAIITQTTYSLPAGIPNIPAETCEPTPEAIASAIMRLSEHQNLRSTLAAEATSYYSTYLGDDAIAEQWRIILS